MLSCKVLLYSFLFFVLVKRRKKDDGEVREEMVREYYRYYRLLNPSEEDT